MKLNELQIFNYKDIPVRTVLLDDEPWWVLKDVCGVLDIKRTDSAARKLDPDEKGTHLVSTLQGPQQMTIINESGLYKVIFRSDKEEAKEFTRWVTHEVLPAIRKTGTYSVDTGGPPAPKLRPLTTDDFIGASRIVSDCRNERLPYVISLLEQGGFKFPVVPAPQPAIPAVEVEEKRTTIKLVDIADFL